MSSRIQIPRKPMATSGIKSLVGKKMTKKVKFMDEEILINKLTVSEVLDIQNKAKELEEANKDPENADAKAGFDVLQTVIMSAVEGGSELSDEDFNGWPMDELTKLSNEIMKFSGIGADQGK